MNNFVATLHLKICGVVYIHYIKLRVCTSMANKIVSYTYYYCVFTVNVIDGEKLMIRKISRLHMGSYLCVASNGVPPTRSKRINVTVHCECMIILYKCYNENYFGWQRSAIVVLMEYRCSSSDVDDS